MEDHYKRSIFLFDRFDKYFAAVNTKGTVYLTINTFFIGAFLTNLNKLNDGFNITEVTALFIGIFLTLCFVSIVLALLAINPFLGDGIKYGQQQSILYYGSISKYDRQLFHKKMSEIEEHELKEDISTQLHCLSIALTTKYQKLSWAGRLILCEFILLIPITIILSINLK